MTVRHSPVPQITTIAIIGAGILPLSACGGSSLNAPESSVCKALNQELPGDYEALTATWKQDRLTATAKIADTSSNYVGKIVKIYGLAGSDPVAMQAASLVHTLEQIGEDADSDTLTKDELSNVLVAMPSCPPPSLQDFGVSTSN